MKHREQITRRTGMPIAGALVATLLTAPLAAQAPGELPSSAPKTKAMPRLAGVL